MDVFFNSDLRNYELEMNLARYLIFGNAHVISRDICVPESSKGVKFEPQKPTKKRWRGWNLEGRIYVIYISIIASVCLFIDSKDCLHEIARRCPLHSCKVSQQMSGRVGLSVMPSHWCTAVSLQFNTVWYLLILEINPEIKKNCQQKRRLLTTMKHSAHAKKPSWSPLPAIALLFYFWQLSLLRNHSRP